MTKLQSPDDIHRKSPLICTFRSTTRSLTISLYSGVAHLKKKTPHTIIILEVVMKNIKKLGNYNLLAE